MGDLKNALNGVKKMSKQELIDKAVEQRKGVIGAGNKNADVIILDGNEFYAVRDGYAKLPEVSSKTEVVCTVAEFQKRARELGWINGVKGHDISSSASDWYCYEQQKPIARPPVGEVVLYEDYDNALVETKILAHHPQDEESVWHEALAVFKDGRSYSTDSYQSFRPLDHATRAKELEKKRVVDTVYALDPLSLDKETLLTLAGMGCLKLP
jgi:hypothetical protein